MTMTDPKQAVRTVNATDFIGKKFGDYFDIYSPDSTIRTLQVRRDNDKIVAIVWTCFGSNTVHTAGPASSTAGSDVYEFSRGEYLESLWLRDSGYGYGSTRQIRFTSTKPTPQGSVTAEHAMGPEGFDNQVSGDVAGQYLCGFRGFVNPNPNPDAQFIQGLSAYYTNKKPE
jgi:hypothetical protein